MAELWVMGEMLVEIMRTKENAPLNIPETFKGPYPSGAPAIFIDTAAKLGHSAGIIGGVGDDDFGKCLLERLKKDGVDISKVLKDKHISTGCAFVTYFSDGSRKFIYHIGNTPAVKAVAPKKECLEGIRYFHIMGCSLYADPSFAKEILKTAERAVEMGAKISFDPNIRKELMGDPGTGDIVNEILDLTSVFLPGTEELLLITGKNNIKEAVAYCFEHSSMDVVALKKGAKGCTVYTKEKEISAGVYPVEAVDATGAGDSFDAAFICGLLEGKKLETIVKMASAAGALNTAAFGPMEGNISKDTIEHMICKEAAI